MRIGFYDIDALRNALSCHQQGDRATEGVDEDCRNPFEHPRSGERSHDSIDAELSYVEEIIEGFASSGDIVIYTKRLG
jgi:hypothetical protein